MEIRRGKRIDKREVTRSQQKKVMRMGRSLPTDAYYTPRSHGKPSKDSPAGVNRLKTTSRLYALFKNVARWGGVLVLIAVFVFNSGLLSTGVKVRFGIDGIAPSPFRSEEEYILAVADVFGRSKFNNSKLTFNSMEFEQEVRELLPEVDSATAIVPLAGTRLQVGLVIGDVLTRFQNGSRTGLLGEDGRLIRADAPASLVGEFLDVPVLTVQPAIEFDDGAQVLTTSELELVLLLLDELDGSTPYRLRPKSITYSIESRELRVSFYGAGYYIKLSTQRKGRTQVGALVASLKEFSEEGVTPQEYIDVRVDGRVFVK